MKDAFNLLGYNVTSAENGEVALKMLRNGNRPCVIILDLMMPVMDGWEFRRVQASDPDLKDIPIVVISADGRAQKKAQALAVKQALVKPIEFDDLARIARDYCEVG
jgi:CheY-like chemotaxis protein